MRFPEARGVDTGFSVIESHRVRVCDLLRCGDYKFEQFVGR